MAVGREIRTKIKSIRNTQKITRAMEMVAASKMRKAQDRMEATRPYAQRIRQVVAHLASAHPEYHHSYLIEREEVKRVGYVIVSTDRGLCGGLNTNLFKATVAAMHAWHEKGVEIEIATMGRKAEAFFKRYGGNIVAQVDHLGDAPTVQSLIGLMKVMLDGYKAGKIDRLFLVYNEFINTMTQKPIVQPLLPIAPPEDQKSEKAIYWDYIYEPDAKELLEALLTRYIESQSFQGVVENIACEQAARMVSMKSASDNASDLIDEFQLIYNKARQASITQELSEIVAGAAAV